MVLGLSACTDSEPKFEPAPANLPEILISEQRVKEIEVGKTDTEITVDFYRQNTAEEVTVPVEFVNPAPAIFEAPSTITFAKGQELTQLVVAVKPLDMTPNSPYGLKFMIGDGQNSSTGLQSVEYEVTYLPWENIVGPNGEIYGTYTDDLLTGLFNLDQTYLTWDVILQQCEFVPGVVRMVNPYEPLPYNGNRYDYSKDHRMYFNISDPANVFLCDNNGSAVDADGKPVYFQSGACLNSAYGYCAFMGEYNYVLGNGGTLADAKEYAGKLENGAITFPKESWRVAMTNYNNLYWFDGCNGSGKYRIAWPGAGADPDDVWLSVGQAQYTDVLICPMYGGDPETWTVEVEQYKKEPTLYRMVNPYKDGIMPDGIPYDGDLYVEIDASNPNCLVVNPQTIWEENDEIDLDGEAEIPGLINIANAAWYYISQQSVTQNQIIAAGLNDTFDGTTFTFRPGNVMAVCYEGTPYQIFSTNNTDEGKLVLNAPATQSMQKSAKASARKASRLKSLKKGFGEMEVRVPAPLKAAARR